MTTHTGYVMTLANSIIGVSLLAMPYCFKQCGVALGIILLLTSNIMTRLSCHFLVKSATMCRRKSFEYVAYHAFGSTGKFFVECGVILFMLGTSVAFFVVIGDLGPAIVSKILKIENTDHLRTCVLLVISVFVILPLCLLRNIESLAAISTVTMFFYFTLVFKLLTDSFPHLAAANWFLKVNFWRPEGVLQCFPIFTMALFCQTQLFEILEVLPNPTLERMNDVVRSAVGLSTGLYIAVGFLGYVAFAREPFGGNVLLSFNPSPMSDLFQLGFVVSIAVSYPIVVFPCRASLNSLLFKKGAHFQELNTQASYITDGRFKVLTAGIIAFALGTGLLIPSVEVVLGFVGSTIAVAICVIFPASAFINISEKKTTERLVAKVILLIGVVVMILGVYGNLDAALLSNPQYVENNPSDSPLPPAIQSQLSKDIPLNIDNKLTKKELENVQPKIDKSARQEPPNPVEPENVQPKIDKSARQEPPNPVEPENVQPKIDKSVRREPPHPVEPEKSPTEPVLKELQKAVTPVSVKTSEKLEPVINVIVPSPVVDLPKNAIHEDAIAKEELQLKEDDSIIKKEQDHKAAELLKKLEEHKQEQQQLLKEQQNILDEIKSRDSEAKPIEPKKFNDNIAKIQEVIDNLKEKKQANDLTMGLIIAEEKKKHEDKKIAKNVSELIEKIVEKPTANISAVPLPLLMKKEPKGVALSRDILELHTSPDPVVREKRDADELEGNCDTDTKNLVENGIKEVNVISAPVVADLPKTSHSEEPKKLSDLLYRREETRRKRRR